MQVTKRYIVIHRMTDILARYLVIWMIVHRVNTQWEEIAIVDLLEFLFLVTNYINQKNWHKS